MKLNELDTDKVHDYYACDTDEYEKRKAEEVELVFSKLSPLAKTIVKAPANRHGHKEVSTCDKPDMGQLVSLVAELDAYYSTLDFQSSIFCALEADGSGSLHVRDYWGLEGNPINPNIKDLLLFQFGCTAGDWLYFSGENCNE